MMLARACGAVAMVLMAAGCAIDRDPPSGQPSFYQSMAQANVEVDGGAATSMISGYRRNNGLGAVALDADLTQLAAEQSRAMAARDKLDHDLVRSLGARLKAGGYEAKLASENIGAGYHTLAEAFSGWRDSPGHRANMLMAGVTRIGIATAYNPKSKYKVYWTLILAAPAERR